MKKLYIINQENTNLYKIGFTRKKLSERIRQLQTGSAHILVEVFQMESEFAPTIERIMQRTFSINKWNGEWFEFDDQTLEKAIVEITKSHRNLTFLEQNKI